MQKFLLALVFCSPAAAAQDDAARLDPETKARMRTEGSVGGIPGGQKTDSQKEAEVSEGASSKATAKKGRVADETSSDREEARGARGSAQEDSSSAGASADAARARAGANASVEGGAALGATGVNSRPAAKAEEAEKDKRRRDRAQRSEKKGQEK